MNYFSDLEGLKMAIKIEEEGYEFYRKAYETTNNPDLKLLLGYFMQEELNHAEKFKAIYEQLKQQNASNDEYLYDDETSRYLHALVETRIFPNSAVFSDEQTLAHGVLQTGWTWQTPGERTSAITAEVVLNFALQAEKDAILFYDELMNNARFPAAKEVFAQLKAEEQMHVKKIQEMLKNL